VLFYPSGLLLAAAARWLEANPSFCVRLIASNQAVAVQDALRGSGAAVIDATRRPEDACAALVHSSERIGPDRTLLYTERMHAGLELFSRTRGVQLVLGPMDSAETAGLGDWLETAGATDPGEPIALGRSGLVRDTTFREKRA